MRSSKDCKHRSIRGDMQDSGFVLPSAAPKAAAHRPAKALEIGRAHV